MAKRIGDQNCWIRIFEVAEPTRHRKGFTVYKVISTVFPKSFPESATKIVVWKRYSDFRKLHKELEQIFKQLFLKGEFPLFPKAKVFGRFEHEVVEERRLAALTLLEFTANHTQLFTSKAFIQFFENGYSTQDFIGQILFSNKGGPDKDPPTTVFAETSEFNAPCLEPQKVWSTKTSLKDEDCLSISASSISSSLSPDATEAPNTANGCDCNPMPTLSTSSNNNLVNDHTNITGTENKSVVPSTPENRNKIPVQNHASTPVPLVEHSQTRRQDGGSDTSESTVNPSSRNSGIVRSATVTDDLSSYFDEDFEDAAFLYPTGSCSSLDTLPGYTPMVDTPDSSQKASSHSNRGIFSLSRRKPNGFGLFDFLPLFPKKSKKKLAKEDQKQVSQDKSDSLVSAGYICEAAGHFAVAQFHESNSEFQDAFRAYKEGIRVLLAGAQDDTDRDRKLLAKNKLEKYLSRAESLKENCLIPGNSGVGGAISPVFSSPNKQAKCLSSLNQSGKGLHPYGDTMLSNLEELKLYKVVGLGSGKNKILVVMNPSEPTPKCYAAKVLWKSPCVVYPDKPNIIPGRVPFMVKLEKWFDTADKIVLLLEHAGGGRLVDFVTNYQSKRISFVSPPDLDTPTENNPTSGLDGVLHEMLKDSNDATGDSEAFNDASLDCAVSQLVRKNNILPGILDERPEIAVASDSVSEPKVPVSDIGDTVPFITPPENSADQTKIVPETCDPTLDMDVSKLLENSKALLQTVSKTLEEGKISKKIEASKPESTPICDAAPKDGSGLLDERKTEDISEVNREALPDNQADAISPTEEDVIQETKEEEGSNTPKRMVPEGCVKVWAAEIIMALEALHDAGITYGDLNINDILLGENGHVLLAYKSLLKDIDDPVTSNYCMAPEVRDSIGVPLWKIHPSADWWSVGAILFLIITGQSFDSAHPEGVFSEMIIKVPESSVTGSQISKAAKTLLVELLHHSPELRLGYYGAAEIKTHPFFEGFDWNMTEEECTAQV